MCWHVRAHTHTHSLVPKWLAQRCPGQHASWGTCVHQVLWLPTPAGEGPPGLGAPTTSLGLAPRFPTRDQWGLLDRTGASPCEKWWAGAEVLWSCGLGQPSLNCCLLFISGRLQAPRALPRHDLTRFLSVMPWRQQEGVWQPCCAHFTDGKIEGSRTQTTNLGGGAAKPSHREPSCLRNVAEQLGPAAF